MRNDFVIRELVKEQLKLRMGITGVTGAGKTFTAMVIARELGERCLFIETEPGRAALYADVLNRDGFFKVLSMPDHSPDTFTAVIEYTAEQAFPVAVIDSFSHAWSGKGGALDTVDKVAARSQAHNNFAAWREVTPMHNRMIEALLAAPFHVICTMREKMEYILEDTGRGTKAPRKVGLAPVQREGMEYEFDIVAQMDLEHNFMVTKTRYHDIDGLIAKKPDGRLGRQIYDWLNSGEAERQLDDPREAHKRLALNLEQDRELTALIATKGLTFKEFVLLAYNGGMRGYTGCLTFVQGLPDVPEPKAAEVKKLAAKEPKKPKSPEVAVVRAARIIGDGNFEEFKDKAEAGGVSWEAVILELDEGAKIEDAYAALTKAIEAKLEEPPEEPAKPNPS